MKRNSGFSLLEILIVVAVFAIISSVIFGTVSSSRVGFASASNQINRQQEARRAINRITEDLKKTNPSWVIGTTPYPVSISSGGNQIDFYLPTFDSDFEVTSLTAVRFFVGGTGNSQLIRRESSTNTVIANDINVGYLGNPLFAFENPPDNTRIIVNIPILKGGTTFFMSSRVNIRNRQVVLGGGVSVTTIIEE